MTSGEKLSAHFQSVTVIRINTFEPVNSEFRAVNDRCQAVISNPVILKSYILSEENSSGKIIRRGKSFVIKPKFRHPDEFSPDKVGNLEKYMKLKVGLDRHN